MFQLQNECSRKGFNPVYDTDYRRPIRKRIAAASRALRPVKQV